VEEHPCFFLETEDRQGFTVTGAMNGERAHLAVVVFRDEPVWPPGSSI
jgi:hypothetical protein